MIGAVGSQAVGLRGIEQGGPGKRAEAVGQQAKAAVAAARDAGSETPRNAQGIAASAVARGIDPASLFAARVAEVGPIAGGPYAAGAEDAAVRTGDIAGQAGDAVEAGRDPDAEFAIPTTPNLELLIDGERTKRAV
ncbi:MAG: hypothetical protein RIE24_23090 [Silicimonas sp.]